MSTTQLETAVAAARIGDFANARRIAEQALLGGQEEKAPLHALLGMVLARSGELKAAAEQLHLAHKEKPQDVTVACNLVAILIDLGQDAAALEVASADLAKADDSLRIARYRGFLAQKLDRFEDAVAAYQLIIAHQPDDFECLNNLGNAQAGMGDHDAALATLRRAVSIDPLAAPTRLNLVSALLALDLQEEAEQELQRASADFQQDSRPPYQLYALYKGQLKQDEAIAALEEAERRDPEVAGIQLKLGIEYGVVRRTDDAERAYRSTIELDPVGADAYLGLAIQYEHTNREEEFAGLIELGRSNGLSDGALAFIEVLELRRQKLFEEALERLSDVPEDLEAIRTAHMRATLLDRLEHTDEAFAAFSHANKLQQESPTEPLKRAAELRQRLKAELELLTPEWSDNWTKVTVTDTRPDPVFLVGFPRSGTTLLDTILMGHPGTVVMEEQPPLNLVEEALGGMAALPDLDDDAITRARDHYFAEVAKIQPLEDGQILIDKSPLFLYRLPLIRRLFPDAKIILALRHPCDVVLSCYMSNFRLNSAMSNFLTLDDAAQFYDLCFTHWAKARELFAPDVHTVVYEELVEDVGAIVQPLIEWLGLDWHEGMLDHTSTAKSRGLITTASYSQVTEPIYRRASGRWLRYAAHLQSITPMLKPWIDSFGYSDSEMP